MRVALTFAEGKVSGTLAMAGQEKQVAVTLPGEIFADGAALLPTVAALPLEETPTTSFYRFDPLGQQVLTCELAVIGPDEVSVAGMTVNALKTALSCNQGEERLTLWLAGESRKVVKTTGSSARMGGATVTRELTP
jgi:hypothetical protein